MLNYLTYFVIINCCSYIKAVRYGNNILCCVSPYLVQTLIAMHFFRWNVKYETPEKNFTELSLTPFQRYVVYVQANTMQSSGVGAISNIIFFTTNMTGDVLFAMYIHL